MSLQSFIEENLGTDDDSTVEPTVVDGQPATQVLDVGDVEKLASVLEFLGASGAVSALQKSAAAASATPTNDTLPDEKNKSVVDTGGTSRGTHHPALASHGAVAKARKKDKSQNDQAALRHAFRNTPYDDPKTGTILTHDTGHKDINAKAKLAAARSELARRAAAAGEV